MKKFCFRNGFTAEIDFENACVHRVVFQNEQLTQGDIPFYAVKLRGRDGSSRIISATEGKFISFDGETAQYIHKEFTVFISVKMHENGLFWRISVQNKTEDLPEWVELMSLGVAKKLQDEKDGKGAILFPYNEGCLVTDMDKRHLIILSVIRITKYAHLQFDTFFKITEIDMLCRVLLVVHSQIYPFPVGYICHKLRR